MKACQCGNMAIVKLLLDKYKVAIESTDIVSTRVYIALLSICVYMSHLSCVLYVYIHM